MSMVRPTLGDLSQQYARRRQEEIDDAIAQWYVHDEDMTAADVRRLVADAWKHGYITRRREETRGAP